MAVNFGDFTVDFESRQLVRGAEEIHVGPKAFELLDLLLRNRPRALSKAQLQNQLWPRTFVSESNLTSVVTELRTALGDKARQPRFIRTVYGFGYAFAGKAEEIPGSARTTTARGVRLRLFLDDREIALREGENILGRVEEAAAWIESASVSRRHARILVTEGKARLEDLGSKNGTFLNGRKITTAVALADADEIRLGLVPMTFRIVSGATSTKTAKA